MKLALFIIMYMTPALSYARGNQCQSDGCAFVGVILAIVGLYFVAISMAESVRKKGLIKGVIEHKAAQMLFMLLMAVLASLLMIKLIA